MFNFGIVNISRVEGECAFGRKFEAVAERVPYLFVGAVVGGEFKLSVLAEEYSDVRDAHRIERMIDVDGFHNCDFRWLYDGGKPCGGLPFVALLGDSDVCPCCGGDVFIDEVAGTLELGEDGLDGLKGCGVEHGVFCVNAVDFGDPFADGATAVEVAEADFGFLLQAAEDELRELVFGALACLRLWDGGCKHRNCDFKMVIVWRECDGWHSPKFGLVLKEEEFLRDGGAADAEAHGGVLVHFELAQTLGDVLGDVLGVVVAAAEPHEFVVAPLAALGVDVVDETYGAGVGGVGDGASVVEHGVNPIGEDALAVDGGWNQLFHNLLCFKVVNNVSWERRLVRSRGLAVRRVSSTESRLL